MASSDIAELVVRIKADSSRLESEMGKASRVVEQSGNKMSTSLKGVAASMRGLLPAIGVTALVGFAKNASIAADALNDLAARTGVAATTFSAMELPLKLAGSSTEEFASSLTRMNNAIGEAASGQSASAVATFQDLGLSIQALVALTPEEQFQEIARALSAIDNQAEFTNKGMAIFGRQFASLSPIIRQTNGDIQELVKTQQALGNAFTEEELKMVGDFWDAYDARIQQAEIGIIRLINRITQFTSIGEPTVDSTNSDIAKLDKEISTRRGALENQSIFRTDRADEANKKALQLAEVQRDALILQRRRVGSVRYNEEFGPQQQRATPAARSFSPSAAISTSSNAAKAATAALEDHTSHTKLYEEAMKKADQQTQAFTESLKNNLSQGLTQAAFTADGAGNAFKNMALQIAQTIFQQSVAKPLSDSIVGGIDGLLNDFGGFSGIFKDILPSFDVGSDYVPKDMVAQIHKGERILTANENRQFMSGGSGKSVTVVQNNTFGNGVSRAELESVLPSVAKAAHDAVFASMQRGGSASKIAGLR